MPELEASRPLLSCRAGRCGPELRVIKIYGKEASELCHGAAVPEGVTVVKEFISREEEREIVAEIDRSQWAESQSGRRKQVREVEARNLSRAHGDLSNKRIVMLRTLCIIYPCCRLHF